MGGYGKLDATGRGEQLKGWFKCYCEDRTRAYKCVGVPSTGGTHVRLCSINSLSVANRHVLHPALLACRRPLKH